MCASKPTSCANASHQSGLAAAEGVLLKEIKWRQNCNYMGYRFVAIPHGGASDWVIPGARAIEAF